MDNEVKKRSKRKYQLKINERATTKEKDHDNLIKNASKTKKKQKLLWVRSLPHTNMIIIHTHDKG